MLKLTGDSEQKVINILWESKLPLKPSEVQSRLDSDLAYNTVLTMMQRLYKKGVLKRYKVGNAFAYDTIETKEESANNNLKKVYSGLINSYGPNLAIAKFLESVETNKESREILKRFLAEMNKVDEK